MKRPTAILAAIVLCAVCLAGCARYEVAGVFTQPVLANYERHAMVGLPQDREQILMAEYIDAFDGRLKRFIERDRLEQLLNEQDILPGRLEQEMRPGYARLLGVEAVIFVSYTEEAAENKPLTQRLTVRIVDAETADVTGSVVLTAFSPSGVSAKRMSRRAMDELVRSLKAHGRRQPGQQPQYGQQDTITTQYFQEETVEEKKLTPSEESRRHGAKPY